MLLFGGTFDPPHRAHIELPLAVRDRLAAQSSPGPGEARRSWLLYVPAAQSPHKDDRPSATPGQRVEMLRLATAGLHRVGVWTEEIDRATSASGSRSLWIDTLRRAREHAGQGKPLRFLIGSDQAANFHRWHAWRDILELASPVVMPRPPLADTAAIAVELAAARTEGGTAAWTPDEIDRWVNWVVKTPIMPMSATEIRVGSVPAERALPPAVAEYIGRHGLYTA